MHVRPCRYVGSDEHREVRYTLDGKRREALSAFIEERFKVKAQKIPRYLRWIDKYHDFAENSPSTADTGDEFLESLGFRYPAWQVEQAEKAVTIYRSFVGKTGHKSAVNGLDNTTWQNVVRNMQSEMRLQNKSLQTERSYLYWVRDFGRYSNRSNPQLLDQSDLSAFLTYFAVERSVAWLCRLRNRRSTLFSIFFAMCWTSPSKIWIP